MRPKKTRFDFSEGSLLPTAQALALDAFAGEIGTVFEDAGVEFVLLKGPTVARWLYEPGTVRGYLDVDLLVSADQVDRARSLLAASGLELSFLEAALPYGRRPHAEAWVNPLNGLSVDLHLTLPGVTIEARDAWIILTDREEVIEVGGRQLPQLAEPARALLVALHAAHHGVKDEQAVGDLSRALDRIDERTWREAAGLADRLGASPAFSAGLRLLPAGGMLADRLALSTARSVETILKASSAPELALSLDWFLRTPGARARGVLLLRKTVPPRRVLRARSSVARRGHAGLALAYALQPLRIAAQAIPAISAWHAARRESRRRMHGG